MLPLVVGVGAAAVGAVLTPIVVPVGLGMVGFGARGPMAGKSGPFCRPVGYQNQTRPICCSEPLLGTMAAGMQASIRNVVPGSSFAAAQSIAMGGPVPAVIVVAGAGITGVAAAAMIWRSLRGHSRHDLFRVYKYKHHRKPFSPGPRGNTATKN